MCELASKLMMVPFWRPLSALIITISAHHVIYEWAIITGYSLTHTALSFIENYHTTGDCELMNEVA